MPGVNEEDLPVAPTIAETDHLRAVVDVAGTQTSSLVEVSAFLAQHVPSQAQILARTLGS